MASKLQRQAGEPNRVMVAATVYDNTRQNVIRVTEDRLRLVLNEHDSLQNKSWYEASGIVVATLSVMATSEPNDVLPKESWWTLFILATGLASIRLAYCVKQTRSAKKNPLSTVDGVIRKLREGLQSIVPPQRVRRFEASHRATERKVVGTDGRSN